MINPMTRAVTVASAVSMLEAPEWQGIPTSCCLQQQKIDHEKQGDTMVQQARESHALWVEVEPYTVVNHCQRFKRQDALAFANDIAMIANSVATCSPC